MEVSAMVANGELKISWSYSSAHYKKENIEQLTHNYMRALRSIIHHCLNRQNNGPLHTPSDYGLTAEVSYQELNEFLGEDAPGMEDVLNF
jgi:non-ribosomal peptide synthase protein (TIGR01720 family)